MARADLAGVQLGMWMGILDERGGDVRLDWLVDPWHKLVGGLTQEDRRWRLAGVVRALTRGEWVNHRGQVVLGAASGLYEERLVQGPPDLSLVWTPTETLQLGVSLGGTWGDLSGAGVVLGPWLSGAGDAGFSLGLRLDAALLNPIEPLTALQLSGGLQDGALQWGIGVEVQGADGEPRRRTLDAQDPSSGGVRALALVLATWIQARAKGDPPPELWRRLAHHLLPMCGEVGVDGAKGPIAPLWPFSPEERSMAPWADSLLAPEGLLTFVWHLRALLTGIREERLFEGSIAAPLVVPEGWTEGAPTLVRVQGPWDPDTPWLVARTFPEPVPHEVVLSWCVGPKPSTAGEKELLRVTSSGWVALSESWGALLHQLPAPQGLALDMIQISDSPVLVLSVDLAAGGSGGPSWVRVGLGGAGVYWGLGGQPQDIRPLRGASGGAEVVAALLELLGALDPGVAAGSAHLAHLARRDPAGVGWLGDAVSGLLGTTLRVPLRAVAGPLHLGPLWLTPEADGLELGLDLSLDLCGIQLKARELGMRVDAQGAHPRLGGVDLGFDSPFLELHGALAQGSQGMQGQAQLRVPGLFAIGAQLGLGQLPGGGTALYAFGALRAPLGGPGFFFVTGVAGGLGLNYGLPSALDLENHPFLRILGGEAPDPAALLDLQEGSFWIAAGLCFRSFGVVDGQLLAMLQLDPFEVQLLGRAALALEPIAALRLDIGAVVSAEQVAVLGGVDGYLLHPDLASVSGEFALIVWPGEGDFVFTLGGYHPDFSRPTHYPARDRLRMRSGWGPLVVEVKGYLAITPRELMVGARVEVSGDFGVCAAGIAAWLDAWIRWDPWFVSFSGGVCIWVETGATGRFEVGVTLGLWTPHLGGRCEVDLTVTTLEVEFGGNPHHPLPSLQQVLERRLGLLPVGGGAFLPFSVGGKVGVFSCEVLRGAVGAGARDTSEQAGQEPDAPLFVLPEFGLQLQTRLPLLDEDPTPTQGGTDCSEWTWELPQGFSSPMSGDLGCTNTLALRLWREPRAGGARAGVGAALNRLARPHPASLFGEGEAELAGSPATVTGVDRFWVRFGPTFHPSAIDVLQTGAQPALALFQELSLEDERYPLPLGVVAPMKPPASATAAGPLRFRERTRRAPPAARSGGAAVELRRGLQRGLRPTAAAPPSGAALLTLPPAATRRPELARVRLRVVDPSPAVLAPLRRITVPVTTAPDGVLSADQALIRTLRPGAAGQLRLRGDQVVRVVVLGRGGQVLADQALSREGVAAVPRGAVQVALLGEGGGAGLPTGGPFTLPVGLDLNTQALALGGDAYVAVGAVLRVLQRVTAALPHCPGDLVPGAALLGGVRVGRVRFAAGLRGALVLRVRGPLAEAGPSVVHLESKDARVGTPTPQRVGDELVLVAPVLATAAFTLRFTVAVGWRVRGLVALPAGPLGSELSRVLPLDLVDERIADRGGSTTLTWELA